jgi:hypothetical protein
MYELDKFPIYADAFNMLCGAKIGSGIHRDVFECKLRPELVVKVEIDREFANVFEMKFWDDHQYYNKVAQWLAPCEFLSPDGKILLQQRCDPISRNYKLPDKLPSFLTDIKRNNFGILNGRLVCIDYAIVISNPSTRLRKAIWND